MLFMFLSFYFVIEFETDDFIVLQQAKIEKLNCSDSRKSTIQLGYIFY